VRSRRALALLAVALVSFVAQASCVSIFGVDAEGLHNVFKDMCSCSELQPLADCERTLNERFDSAGSATRADWLDRYDKNDCSDCKNVLTCLSATPTCSVDTCSRAEECCPMGDTQATCGEDHACHR
jgi:hypothetical protein